MLPMRMFLRSFSSFMWFSTSSNCATAKTFSSLAKPMRLQEPRHESAQLEGQRNGCRYEKEQASHDLTASIVIQHHWLPVSVWYLPKMIKGTVKGQGSLTYYPYPYPQGPLPIILKGYPYPCYCLSFHAITFVKLWHEYPVPPHCDVLVCPVFPYTLNVFSLCMHTISQPFFYNHFHVLWRHAAFLI